MTEITTKAGTSLKIDETKLNDMELFDSIVGLQDGDTTQIPRILKRLLSPEEKEALYENVRGEDGRVPIEAVTAELGSIFSGLEEASKK